ncbi:hypothetical protein RHSIM_Rhsim05G0210700 [Rhododendron simsii]|uniref:Leucine-rich repeat-containing N-terminal plant-type domain-containing protein n=1 Tax=Rhododendron simsii TaxID=118357 RepID=A0A834H068_RHOSS|nr:hypothetical protein RHSIM_Rhsim05G0210700 [Rhododendron simsii]
MEPSYAFCPILLVLLISGLECVIASTTSGNETDRIALLDFKKHITQDPFQIMSSWNDSLQFCNWVGIECNPTNGRIMVFNLESQNLSGSIPPSIGNLTFLTGFNLKHNNFQGEIPQEIGRLLQLQHLNLSYNSFSGKIPSNISQCRELTIFRATKNELVGQIPEQLGSLSKLVYLVAESNNLSGVIPASIGNLSSLYLLSLMQNSLRGTIPEQIGLLSACIDREYKRILLFFALGKNASVAPAAKAQVPSAAGKAGLESAIASSSTSGNETDRIALLDFKKHITQDPFQIMPSWNDSLQFCNWVGIECNPTNGRVMVFNLESQNLSGSIPPSIGNLTFLTGFNLKHNNFQGEIPQEIGRLLQLQHLNLSYNSFSGKIPRPIPVSLSNASGLTLVDFAQNSLTGTLSRSLGILQDRSVLWEEEGNKVYVENEEVRNEDRAIISDHDSQNTVSTSKTVMDSMVSVLEIGLSCSASLPRARMPMNIVVNKMYAIRDSYQRSKKRNERTTP